MKKTEKAQPSASSSGSPTCIGDSKCPPGDGGSRRSQASAVPFHCEACGLRGEVYNPKNMEGVSCKCGAYYLYWPQGMAYGQASEWKCVVRPFFAPPKSANEKDQRP